MASFEAKFPVLQELFAKNHRGAFGPPSSGARDIKKNPKYANSRHLCPYRSLRISKSSDHWCAFGMMSNFEKRNLRSGHLM